MTDDVKSQLVKMAFLYVQSEEWYKAIGEYQKLLALDPDDAHVYNMMGDAYAKKKDDGDALQAYLKAKELYEARGQSNKSSSIDRKIGKLSADRMDSKRKQYFLSIAKTLEADRLAAEGQLDEAVDRYHQLIAAEPANMAYRDKLATLLLDHAMVSEALAQLKSIADFHISEGRIESAKPFAARMSLIDPSSIDTHRLLAFLAEKSADPEGVGKHFGALAPLAFEAGAYEEAKKAVDVAIQSGRRDLRPLRARVLVALKQFEEAKKQFAELLAEDPGNEELNETLLGLCEETKDWKGAHERILALSQKRPDDAKLKPRMARILLQVGQKAEALKLYVQLAVAALKENRPEAAIGHFDSILLAEPENVEVLKKRAETFLKMGKKQETIDAYKKLQVVYNHKKMADEARQVGILVNKLSGFKG